MGIGRGALHKCGCQKATADGALPQTPGFLRHGSGVRYVKEKPLTGFVVRGLVLDRRTVDLAIPCRVASPQSPAPFHQTGVSVT
jgi:hypothetical protein